MALAAPCPVPPPASEGEAQARLQARWATESPSLELGGCERLGILMPRLLHDLGNCLTVIAGNTHLARRAASPEAQARALAALNDVGERAGEQLQRFNRIARAAQNRPETAAFAEAIQAIEAARFGWTEWTLGVQSVAPGRVAGPARWHAFAVWELVRLSGARRGTIGIQTCPLEPDQAAAWSLPGGMAGRPGLRIELHWESVGRWIPAEEGHRPTAMERLLVFELYRWLGGAARYLWVPPGTSRCLLAAPGLEPDRPPFGPPRTE
jgi:hypothetical protein